MAKTKDKAKLNGRRGEGYIDLCVGFLCFAIMISITINLFSLVVLRVRMDTVANNILTTSTASGRFGTEYDDMVALMEEDYGDFTCTASADSYYNTATKEVQLGEKMYISITVDTTIGSGDFAIPTSVTVKKTGLSERYWKE